MEIQNKIEIYQSENKQTEIAVQFDKETVWLDAHVIAQLFDVQRPAVVKHINNIFNSGELQKTSTCSILEQVAADGKNRKMKFYNLDVIISVGYRVNSTKATQFRQWATQRLKDYLVKGYAINEQRLEQKQQEVLHLKTGIQILSRAIEAQNKNKDNEILSIFAKGLELLDDYDHEELDVLGQTTKETIFPTYEEYLDFIGDMYSNYESDVFAKPKDESFHSSINQIAQTFEGKELYSSIQEKAANLLYFIVKNHSFVDGNKRIAAACFLLFLDKNNALMKSNNESIISNEALASLTLFIATSKSEEAEVVKRFVISILNRSTSQSL
ncbi:MAG: virulence protein RhuM/Fic/DOC family protein [Bacteroidales bacterium]|nr:virulence protein RhuM/Fic/DOC family protein [Bacteroidales bacterium]